MLVGLNKAIISSTATMIGAATSYGSSPSNAYIHLFFCRDHLGELNEDMMSPLPLHLLNLG